MPIDNDIYNRLGRSWWDGDNPLNLLHGSMTAARFGYFRQVLAGRTGHGPAPARALDVGCGGGFLAEEFARAGYHVVGVDPSEVSLQAARRHAVEHGLEIDYRAGAGERLPVRTGGFDVVYCADVLEHVADVDAVIGECARALKPDGVFLFDTINRTRASRLLVIKVMQQWRFTRVLDTALHDWDMFITPDELAAGCARHGLRIGELAGLAPRTRNPLRILDFGRARRGAISYGELGRRLDFGRVRSTAVSYMGFAVAAGPLTNRTDPLTPTGPGCPLG
ncbi:bifunctional 2-polyprenyl-6-hydroxyphenol methylase/3-demethylubiquinol 3-O-methyltransferase UbiG [Specibacter cremeus]|uniref:bifunctional 2-polyprenyl-6-hydroxyphenol methylase/3-demethylubiquinol 3-O-methyltransferase UbiG n=1 Tax=Specibacter cremeus TaxID=1629051 RepID=UPI000F79E064|nr:bifunctional 2-polyprenyl-6-hydroxyphenol methylase/3-demethylubiquinol 3-O-methyltransferase UbiG [Specibacter cremeus]